MRLTTMICALVVVAGVVSGLRAQCTVSMQVNPPYSVYLQDYLQHANRCVMSVGFSGNQPRDVKFRITLSGSNGVVIRTKDSYQPSTPFRVQPGQTYQFTGAQLQQVIDIEQLDFAGVSREQITRSGMLPEGIYQFCAQVLDYQNGQAMSEPAPSGCSNTFEVRQFDPPIITLPQNGAQIRERDAQSLMVAWMPPPGAPAPIEYRLRVAEVLPGQSTHDALHNTSTLFFDKVLYGTSYNWLPGDRKPAAGKKYGMTVTATTTPSSNFKNGGESEVVAFDVKFEDPPPKDTAVGGGGGVAGGAAGGDGGQPPVPYIIRIYGPPPGDIDSEKYERLCIIAVDEVKDTMVGGLHDSSFATGKKIRRDDYIPLRAIGVDYDAVQWKCLVFKKCDESEGNIKLPLTSRVRFEWKITSGPGSFKKLGVLPDGLTTDAGDMVIFEPPYVAQPDSGKITEETTTITLTTIDNNKTQITDPPTTKTVTIVTRRKWDAQDFYFVDVESERIKLPKPPAEVKPSGTCVPIKGWDKPSKLPKPEIVLPAGIPNNDKLVSGQWMLLAAKDMHETDHLMMICKSPSCTGETTGKPYEDNIQWEWRILRGGGKLLAHSGQMVVYEAGEVTDDKGVTVKIEVKVTNPEGLQTRDFVNYDTIEFKAYRPGIELSTPPAVWIPGADNTVMLSSRLLYRDDQEWKAALPHMGRIMFSELVRTSHEPGVCTNFPPRSEAQRCPDLAINAGADIELCNIDTATPCKEPLYTGGRSRKPSRTQTVTVQCRDYGAYGALAAFAVPGIHNGKEWRKETPYYQQVSTFVPPKLVKKKLVEIDSNTVTIPTDRNGNGIPDAGWKAHDNDKVTYSDRADPKEIANDDDEEPPLDKYRGDGLTLYEEYRGFMIKGGKHIRTNPTIKDLFLFMDGDLPLDLFISLTGIKPHFITEDQFDGTESRLINGNKFTPNWDVCEQRGLWLVDEDPGKGLLGNTTVGTISSAAPPSWVYKVQVGKAKLVNWCAERKMTDLYDQKLKQVVAHELCHGCNVAHHGEEPAEAPTMKHGLRSGDWHCIMRYDNTEVGLPEPIGTTLCTSGRGTGVNARNGGQSRGDARKGRGDCQRQLRISGRSKDYRRKGIVLDAK